MKLTDYIANFLEEKKFDFNYIFTGGAIAHVIDSCWQKHESNPKVLKPICVLHEQAGSMAIDAYSRISGKPGLMMVTSGPGATNLLTGIACSFYDSIPGLYITGQVRTWELKGESKQRQLGFQETDIVSMAKPITKYAVLIESAQDIRYELEKAYWLCLNGRSGPVLIDLPMDLQCEDINPGQLRPFVPPLPASAHNSIKSNFEDKVSDIINVIVSAKKPLILCGAGIRSADAVKELFHLSTHCQLPVVSSFGGNDAFPHNHPHYCGLVGTMGNKAANALIQECDLLLVLGARLSWRQVRSKPELFANHAKIIHVDIDREELNQRVGTYLAFALDVKYFINQVMLSIQSNQGDYNHHQTWVTNCRQQFLNNSFEDVKNNENKSLIQPYQFMKSLSKSVSNNDVIILDTGQNVMWGMQALELKEQQRLLTAWGHSPMGYSLPAAIGVSAYLSGGENVICLIGDGGFQLNIQELQTIAYHNLSIKIFILNNHSYGAIKDFNRDNLDNRLYATSPGFGYQAPDFIAIAQAYKIPTFSIASNTELQTDILQILKQNGPVVCDVDLGDDTRVMLDPL